MKFQKCLKINLPHDVPSQGHQWEVVVKLRFKLLWSMLLAHTHTQSNLVIMSCSGDEYFVLL